MVRQSLNAPARAHLRSDRMRTKHRWLVRRELSQWHTMRRKCCDECDANHCNDNYHGYRLSIRGDTAWVRWGPRFVWCYSWLRSTWISWTIVLAEQPGLAEKLYLRSNYCGTTEQMNAAIPCTCTWLRVHFSFPFPLHWILKSTHTKKNNGIHRKVVFDRFIIY